MIPSLFSSSRTLLNDCNHCSNVNFWMSPILLLPEFFLGRQRQTCGPTLSTNQMRTWD